MAPRECKGPRLFVEGLRKRGAVEPNSLLPLSPQDSHYLKDVLRLPVGALVEIGDPNSGETFTASISSLAEGVTLSIREKIGTTTTDLAIILLCALCKGQKNELITDWATELGCSEIIFWQADRSIVRLKSEGDAEGKAQKLSKAALAAAQQSRQIRPPRVHVTTSLANALKLLSPTPRDLALICSLDHEARPISTFLTTHPSGGRIFITIGPEGDLTPSESETLRNHGFTAVSLGRKILRSELAALVALVSVTTGTSLD